MREYKFRAWDKIDKRLIIDKQDFIPLVVTNKGVFKLDPTCEYDRWIEIDKNRFDLMQYTGLKDKNEVDIYEGDIIELGKINEKIFAGVVIFNEDIFGVPCFCIQENEYTFHTFFDKDDDEKFWFEVIGSIYENPELLN